MRLVISYNF